MYDPLIHMLLRLAVIVIIIGAFFLIGTVLTKSKENNKDIN